MTFQKNKLTAKKEDFSNLKNSIIQFRITKSEKRELKATAKASGHDTVSAYLLWLHRKRINEVATIRVGAK